MAKHKLSWRAAEVLLAIAERTSSDGDYWLPALGGGRGCDDWSSELGRHVNISGSVDARIIESLWRKGLTKQVQCRTTNINKYASRLTEDGRLLIEHWRETDTWPCQVKQ